jgi:hypothetical protein
MKTVRIFRVENSKDGTFGVLSIDDQVLCITLERPWLNNTRGNSCIPWGRFHCTRVQSKRFGDTFEVENVPGRSGILFHSGNRAKDSKGCIILAHKFYSFSETDRGVVNSKEAFSLFLQKMKGENNFMLLIADVKIMEV